MWRDQAACRGTDPDLFFPSVMLAEERRAMSETERAADRVAVRAATVAAKTLCADCPVQAECLDYANGERVEFGVWGGKTPGERQKGRPRSQAKHGTRGHYNHSGCDRSECRAANAEYARRTRLRVG